MSTPAIAYSWSDFFAVYLECPMWADGPQDYAGDIDDNAPDPEGDQLQAMATDACAWFCRNFADLSSAADCSGLPQQRACRWTVDGTSRFV